MQKKKITKLGRRPVADKKKPVTIYIYESEIKDSGGIAMARNYLESSWNNRIAAKSSSI